MPYTTHKLSQRASKRTQRKEGIALIIAMTAVAILSVMLADLHENTGVGYATAIEARDRLRAEYLAVSAIHLTRLLVALEPDIRESVTPLIRGLLGRSPPQIPVWNFATTLLEPFCDYEQAVENGRTVGVDWTKGSGLGEIGGVCSVMAVAENSKINVNKPLFYDGDNARRSLAQQLFAVTGGYQSPSLYDPLFDTQDSDGQFNTRLDTVSAVIDWWDYDQDRTLFDPGAGTISTSGPEDDVYRLYRDPYQTKNAPFDSLEEIRMVRGVGEDFWATFVEPDPEDPKEDLMTIYGSGAVNPNEAKPEVLLARVCSTLSTQTLCNDPLESTKFLELLKTVRSMFPLPWFSSGADFLNFLEGKGGDKDLYPMISSFLGPDSMLLFKPITIAPAQRTELTPLFVVAAQILTIEGTGEVGQTFVKIRTVANFHDRWTPPPPNAGVMPRLGIFYYWRME